MLNNHSRLTLILSRPENGDKKYILHILTHLELNYRDETHHFNLYNVEKLFSTVRRCSNDIFMPKTRKNLYENRRGLLKKTDEN